jgi:hypothetical protein|tara:strand:- start:1032 stop:1319 length:288 start_codon:yes stop_codon:yes gene_type:complete
MKNDITRRRKTYHTLNTHCAQCDDRQLLALLAKNKGTRVYNDNQGIRLGRNNIFVKKIPVTQLEYDNPHSTNNHYRLSTPLILRLALQPPQEHAF